MRTPSIKKTGPASPLGNDFFHEEWETSWTYIKTVVDVVHEPVLILDAKLCVLAANEPFYHTFQVAPKDTESTLVYKLGNGQWDIPDLRRLLEDILPKNTFFKGFQVTHDFPHIGRKVMMLNGREIHQEGALGTGGFPPIILLAIEDITEMMGVAESFAGHVSTLETKFGARANDLEHQIKLLQLKIKKLQLDFKGR